MPPRSVGLIGLMLLSITAVTLAGQCHESWEEEVHGKKSILCCHVPLPAVKRPYLYCRSLGARLGVDQGTLLCFKRGSLEDDVVTEPDEDDKTDWKTIAKASRPGGGITVFTG